jgi:hypothetical protein
MDQAMGVLEVIAPLRRVVEDNLRRLHALTFTASERFVKGTIGKVGVSEVPCKNRAIREASKADKTG